MQDLTFRIDDPSSILCFFFFNDPPTTELYTLSLHDALPISFFTESRVSAKSFSWRAWRARSRWRRAFPTATRSEEHTSELQSRQYLVCRLLLEKKKQKNIQRTTYIRTPETLRRTSACLSTHN